MNPSIKKLLEEDDEDETLHSGADVDAFTAALNRDVTGDDASLDLRAEGLLIKTNFESIRALTIIVAILTIYLLPTFKFDFMQDSISTSSSQLLGQCQNISEDKNLPQQISQQDQQHLHSIEKHSSQIVLVQQGSGAENQNPQLSDQSECSQFLLQQEKSHSDTQQGHTKTNPLQFVDKIQVTDSEKNSINCSRQDCRQLPESQEHHMKQQLNSQQETTASLVNGLVNQIKPADQVPFGVLIPILCRHLDKDRSMQLQAVYAKLKNNEIAKEDFLRISRNIAGDQILRQAALLVQKQTQGQARATQPTSQKQIHEQNHSSSSQQLSSQSVQQLTEPKMPLAPMSSLQSQKGHQPSSHHTHVTDSTSKINVGTSFSVVDNSDQKSREIGNNSDGKGVHSVQKVSSSTDTANTETGVPVISIQAANKQQQRLPQFPTSSAMFGKTSNIQALKHPRIMTSPTATVPLKPQSRDSEMIQPTVNNGMVSTQSGGSRPLNLVNAPKYELQNASNEIKILHGGSICHMINKSALQQNSVVQQLPPTNMPNNEQRSGAFSSIVYVKKEVIDQADEPQQKPLCTTSQGSSFGSGLADQGNPTPGSAKVETRERKSSIMGVSTPTSLMPTSQTSVPVETNVDSLIQMRSQGAPTISQVPAGNTRTPPKGPFIGQKKPLEVQCTPLTHASKKQKTSGAFLEQSIEQLNDVTAVSGVNIREEQEQLLFAPKEDRRASEATRRVVQEEEDRLILQKAPLQKKLADITSKCGIQNVSCDVEHCLSLCVEERLRRLISHLIRCSKKRFDLEKTKHHFVVTSDVRNQILMMNRKTKEEWEKKQAEEAEKLRKLNECTQVEWGKGSDTGKDKDEGRSKTQKLNKEEEDKMRTMAANVAARNAVGGDDMLSRWQLMSEQRQKREQRMEGPSGSQLGSSYKHLQNFGGSPREQETGKRGFSAPFMPDALGSMRKFRRNPTMMSHQRKVVRSISAKDVIAALEREPQMNRSSLLYSLYEKRPSNCAVE